MTFLYNRLRIRLTNNSLKKQYLIASVAKLSAQFMVRKLGLFEPELLYVFISATFLQVFKIFSLI